jgi:hypothetical protein
MDGLAHPASSPTPLPHLLEHRKARAALGAAVEAQEVLLRVRRHLRGRPVVEEGGSCGVVELVGCCMEDCAPSVQLAHSCCCCNACTDPTAHYSPRLDEQAADSTPVTLQEHAHEGVRVFEGRGWICVVFPEQRCDARRLLTPDGPSLVLGLTFPSCARPFRKRRCSSELHGCPAHFLVATRPFRRKTHTDKRGTPSRLLRNAHWWRAVVAGARTGLDKSHIHSFAHAQTLSPNRAPFLQPEPS